MQRDRVVSAVLIGLVVVLILVAGIWWLFLDTPPVTGSELNSTTPDHTVSTAPPEFTMRVEVQSRSLDDASEQANWSAGVLYNSDAGERLGWLRSTAPDRTITITHYQRYTDARTHNYIKYHNSDTEQFTRRVGSIREDLDRDTETLHVDNTSQTYTYYREGDREEFEVMPDQIPPLGFIHTIPFRHAGTTTVNGTRVEKYEPVNGWTERQGSVADDGPDTHISNTSGELSVSADSGNVIHVDVSFRSIRTDVRAGKWFGDSGNRVHISLSVRKAINEEDLEPEWVNSVSQETSHAGSSHR